MHSVGKPAGEMSDNGNVEGARDWPDSRFSNIDIDFDPFRAALTDLCSFAGIEPESIATGQFLGPYACGGKTNFPQTFRLKDLYLTTVWEIWTTTGMRKG